MVGSTLHQTPISELFSQGRTTVSAEIIPPRNGAEASAVLEQISLLQKVPVDFISVTKGAGGSLRGGTLPIAQTIKTQFGICSLAHFTCRDYTIEEIENNLMDHHYFGVQNILALRGDPPDGKPDTFAPAPNRHTYAWQLVDQISAMNRGEYIVREGFDEKTSSGRRQAAEKTRFCIGVAAHPEHQPLKDGVDFLKLKVEKGAEFAITQMIFSAEIYSRFLEACSAREVRIPVIPGLRILPSAASAERMAKKFGVHVPTKTIERLSRFTDKDSMKKAGLECAVELAEDLVAAGAPGIHAFVMSDAKLASELLARFAG